MKFRSIRENHLFVKAYSKGKRFVTASCAVYILPDYKKDVLKKAHPLKITVNRIGLTATKKLGGAVVRSRARRVLREAYREVDRKKGIRVGYLVVICAREACVGMKSTEVARDLERALARLEMLK